MDLLTAKRQRHLFTRGVNDLSDALNSLIPVNALYKGSSSHSLLNKFLDEINEGNNTFASKRTLDSLRVILKSTLEVSAYLWSKGFKYIPAKFNQDPLERNFGILRSLSCDDHPSTIDFLH